VKDLSLFMACVAQRDSVLCNVPAVRHFVAIRDVVSVEKDAVSEDLPATPTTLVSVAAKDRIPKSLSGEFLLG
jgi:hypothetical protein